MGDFSTGIGRVGGRSTTKVKSHNTGITELLIRFMGRATYISKLIYNANFAREFLT
jgi:hypothetical protein